MQQQNPSTPESWDMVIGPPKGWFDLHLCGFGRKRGNVGRDFVLGDTVVRIGWILKDGGGRG